MNIMTLTWRLPFYKRLGTAYVELLGGFAGCSIPDGHAYSFHDVTLDTLLDRQRAWQNFHKTPRVSCFRCKTMLVAYKAVLRRLTGKKWKVTTLARSKSAKTFLY